MFIDSKKYPTVREATDVNTINSDCREITAGFYFLTLLVYTFYTGHVYISQ